jgi:hypothetical protein
VIDTMRLIRAVINGQPADIEAVKVELIDLIVNGAETTASGSLNSFGVGQYCIIRTYSAGVLWGIVVARNGLEVQLSNARRIFYWDKAFTLSAIANGRLGDGSKLSESVESILITEAIEVIPCSQEATNNLIKVKAHDPN